jgi:hypothetical protein
LERYLAELDELRADLTALPARSLAVAVLDHESAGSSVFEALGALRRLGAPGPPGGAFVHVWDAKDPVRSSRSTWSFPIVLDAGKDLLRWWGIATLHGRLEPGAAIAVTISGRTFLPVGPLRPLIRGARWRPPTDVP